MPGNSQESGRPGTVLPWRQILYIDKKYCKMYYDYLKLHRQGDLICWSTDFSHTHFLTAVHKHMEGGQTCIKVCVQFMCKYKLMDHGKSAAQWISRASFFAALHGSLNAHTVRVLWVHAHVCTN